MLNMHPQKIAIGSTKLGLAYGAVNQRKVPENQALDIFRHVKSLGFDMIDTAPSYGNAQQLIGRAFQSNTNSGVSDLKVVTKLSAIQAESISQSDVDTTRDTFLNSLQEMNMSSIYGVLIHHCADLSKKGAEQLVSLLQSFKADGFVKKIGVSVYTTEEARRFFQQYEFDLIQLPLNVFDQRFLDSDTLNWLSEKQVEIHARSLFLKGVLLKPDIKHGLPPQLLKQNEKFHACLTKNNVDPYKACMYFASMQTLVDRWVIGVSSTEQIDAMLELMRNEKSVMTDSFDFEAWHIDSDVALDPRRW